MPEGPEIRRAAQELDRAQFLAYGREGEPCRTCGTAIERTEAGNRGLFHCPACQPAL